VAMAEVAVIGGGHNPGDCISTVELPGGRGRLEVGAYEHGGLRGSGVAAELELETRFGLRFHLRDQTTLAPCRAGLTRAELRHGAGPIAVVAARAPGP
jgi:beta-carotene ketolase (CrtO type)